MSDREFFRQVGIGVASLTFGVALSIFIYAAASGLVSSAQTLLLYATSFLLMLRFWWRYTELFVRFIPSQSFWHFLFDFLVSLFGIAAVLFIGNVQSWAAAGGLAMLASSVRCWLARGEVAQREKLRMTLKGAVGMLAVMAAVYMLAPLVGGLPVSATVFLLVLAFTIYASVKP